MDTAHKLTTAATAIRPISRKDRRGRAEKRIAFAAGDLRGRRAAAVEQRTNDGDLGIGGGGGGAREGKGV